MGCQSWLYWEHALWVVNLGFIGSMLCGLSVLAGGLGASLLIKLLKYYIHLASFSSPFDNSDPYLA